MSEAGKSHVWCLCFLLCSLTCSALFRTLESPSLPGPALATGTDLRMLQSSCTGSTSPLTTWRMQRLNLKGQGQCVIAFSVDLEASPFHTLFRACLFPCQAQGQQGTAAVGTKHTHLPKAAFLAHFSPLFWDLIPCIGSPKDLGEKMMPSNLPAGARRISGSWQDVVKPKT